MTGYLNGVSIDISHLDIELAPSFPISFGTFVHTSLLNVGDEIYSPDTNIKLFVQHCEAKEDLFVATLVDRLGFIEDGALLYNKLYVPGTYYDTILALLLPDLSIEYRNGLSAKSYQYLSLPSGYKKADLLNGLFSDLMMRLIIDENNNKYIIDEISDMPSDQWTGHTNYFLNLETTINSYTVTNSLGLSKTAYVFEDLQRYGLLQGEEVGTYLLYGGEEIGNLAKYRLQKILGQRKKMTCVRPLSDFSSIQETLNACWLIGNEKYRIESVKVIGNIAKFGGYKLEDVYIR